MGPELKKMILNCKTWDEFEEKTGQYCDRENKRVVISRDNEPEVHEYIFKLYMSRPKPHEKTEGPPDSNDSGLRESIRREREEGKR